jgi:hypothetical protein
VSALSEPTCATPLRASVDLLYRHLVWNSHTCLSRAEIVMTDVHHIATVVFSVYRDRKGST